MMGVTGNGTPRDPMVSTVSPRGPTEPSKDQEAVEAEKPAECAAMNCDQFPANGLLSYDQRMHEILYHGAGR